MIQKRSSRCLCNSSAEPPLKTVSYFSLSQYRLGWTSCDEQAYLSTLSHVQVLQPLVSFRLLLMFLKVNRFTDDDIDRSSAVELNCKFSTRLGWTLCYEKLVEDHPLTVVTCFEEAYHLRVYELSVYQRHNCDVPIHLSVSGEKKRSCRMLSFSWEEQCIAWGFLASQEVKDGTRVLDASGP
jgi:hypothetical protein